MKTFKEYLTEATLSPSQALNIFGLSSVPDAATLKAKFKSLALQFHPDRGGDVEKMKMLNVAYELLSSSKDSVQDFQAQYAERKAREAILAEYMLKMFASHLDAQKFSVHFADIFGDTFQVEFKPYVVNYGATLTTKWFNSDSSTVITLTLYGDYTQFIGTANKLGYR